MICNAISVNSLDPVQARQNVGPDPGPICLQVKKHATTVVPTKSDGDIILCLPLLSKTLTGTLHLS